MAMDNVHSDSDSEPCGASDIHKEQLVTWRQWYAVSLLTLLLLLSFVDRSSLNLLAPLIRTDLHLTDVQLSLLLGVAFSLFYSLCGLPSGYLVDRFNRRILLCGAIIVWSLMTAACGFSFAFGPIFIGRAGVGVGEAFISPVAFSVISDSFPKRLRARAMSIYFLGSSAGPGLSLMIVGSLVGLLPASSLAHLGLLGNFQSWQVILMIVGFVGLPMSLLVWTFREPARRRGENAETAPSWGAAVRYLGRARWTIIPTVLAFGFAGMGAAGSVAWTPSYIIHAWGLPVHKVGVTLGMITMISAVAGTAMSGYVLDWAALKFGSRGVPVTGAIAAIASFTAWQFVPYVNNLSILWVLLAVTAFLPPWAIVASTVTLSRASPGEMAGKFSALFFLCYNLLGYSVGPTLVAMLEKFFTGPAALGHAISFGAGGAQGIWGLLLLTVAWRGLRPGSELHAY